MGGHSFRIPCSLKFNGLLVTNISALPDTGADGLAFIDQACAVSVASFLGVKARKLPRPIYPKGYGGQRGTPITHFICFDLLVDSRTLLHIPFLILKLGSADIILGMKWLAYFDIKIDAARQRLVWPSTIPPLYNQSFAKQIACPYEQLSTPRVERQHQREVYKRDAAFEHEDRQRCNGRASSPPAGPEIASISCAPMTSLEWPVSDKTSFHKEMARRMRRMEAELRMPQYDERPIIDARARKYEYRRLRKEKTAEKPGLAAAWDIAEISAIAFDMNMQRRENTVFVATISDIERELESRHIAAEEDELGEMYTKLPPKYHSYADVFSKAASNTLAPHRSYDHRIILENDTQLSHGPLYSQSNDELLAVRNYLRENLDKGFIEPSQAPFSSPILFVKKPDGQLRFCIDFRKLNQITRKDRYPLPLIDETLNRLNRAKVFTKLDIRQAFHRIRMHPESEELTTFRTRYGAYKCKVLPFGLTNGPATYQRYMNDILMEYLDVFCTAYLDDILIYSEDPLEHESHVKLVLERLRAAGLQADLKKCEFDVTSTKYLGFIVSTSGISVDPTKVEAVEAWKPPRTVKGVQAFLGFCNFYRRFIKNYGSLAKPLVHLTKAATPWNFDNTCQKAFDELKCSLTSAPILAHYDFAKESRVETDASDGVLAAVFSQKGDDGLWHPVGYFSKTMAPAEMNYEIHDKEMLAIIRSLSHWRAELQGSPSRIEIMTDHKALEYFMTTKQLNARQARWSELLASFFFQIVYRPGVRNQLADALSRREQDVDPQDVLKGELRYKPLLKPENIAEELRPIAMITTLESDKLVESILMANRTHESLEYERKRCADGHKDLRFDDDLLLYRERLIVPDVNFLRTKLIHEAHSQLSTAHPGARKTEILLRERYYWKGMSADIKRFVDNCHACQRGHHRRDKTPGLLHPLPIADRPWQHICVDFKSQPRDRRGFDNICVFIDRFSKVPVSIPCHKTATALDMAEMYYTHVYRYYDLPDSIVSDRGPQFISEFWAALNAILGVKLLLSTAHSPQTDGQTEIMNEYNDQRLRPFVEHYQDNWSELLPAMDNAQLTLPHSSLGGMTPFMLTRGYSPRKSFDWKAPAPPKDARGQLAFDEATRFARRLYDGWKFAQDSIARAQEKNIRDANRHRREPDFDVGDRVYLSTKNLKLDRPTRKLADQYTGPFEIVEKVGHSFRLKLPLSWRIHDVFHARFLRKDPNNPLPGQENTIAEPLNITGENEYTVERILAVKRDRGGILKYRASWLGYDDDPSYYPASDFMYSPHKLREFHLNYPDKPGPPARLPSWLNAYEQGIDNYDELASSRPMTDNAKADFFR